MNRPGWLAPALLLALWPGVASAHDECLRLVDAHGPANYQRGRTELNFNARWSLGRDGS